MQYHRTQNAPMNQRGSCLKFGFRGAANWLRKGEIEPDTVSHPTAEGKVVGLGLAEKRLELEKREKFDLGKMRFTGRSIQVVPSRAGAWVPSIISLYQLHPSPPHTLNICHLSTKQ